MSRTLDLESIDIVSSSHREAGSGRLRLSAAGLSSIQATLGDALTITLWAKGNPSANLIFLCVASVHTQQAGVDAPALTVPALLSPCVQLPIVSSTNWCEVYRPSLLTGPLVGRVKTGSQRILAARAIAVIPSSGKSSLAGIILQLRQHVIQAGCLVHIGESQALGIVTADPSSGPVRVTAATVVTLADLPFSWPLHALAPPAHTASPVTPRLAESATPLLKQARPSTRVPERGSPGRGKRQGAPNPIARAGTGGPQASGGSQGSFLGAAQGLQSSAAAGRGRAQGAAVQARTRGSKYESNGVLSVRPQASPSVSVGAARRRSKGSGRGGSGREADQGLEAGHDTGGLVALPSAFSLLVDLDED